MKRVWRKISHRQQQQGKTQVLFVHASTHEESVVQEDGEVQETRAIL